MKKVTVILSLSIVAVCGFVAIKVWNTKPAWLHQDPFAQAEVKPSPQATPTPTPEPKQELSVAERMKIDHQKTDEGIARLRKSSTPEILAAIRKRQLEKTQEDYGAFFESLDLEEATVHHALDIILERERKYLDIYETFNETGMSKGLKDFGESRKVEQSVAEVQLRHLLGDERYGALVEFEKERQAQMQTQAQRFISKYLND